MLQQSSFYSSTLKACVLVLPALVLSAGCVQMVPVGAPPSQAPTNTAKNSAADPGDDALKLVAIDLVNAMIQVESLQPAQVRLHMREPRQTFGKLLHATLTTVGYGVETGHVESTTHSVSYSITEGSTAKTSTSNGFSQTYQVNIGDVKLRRDYGFIDGQVKPQSHLFLRGADSSGIRLDDSLFVPAPRQTAETGKNISRHDNDETTVSTTVPATDELLSMQLLHRDESESYRAGESIEISVVPALDAHLYCYYQDGLDTIAQVFPNRFSPDSKVAAGATVLLPGSDRWQLTATQAGKPEQFMCIAVDPDSKAELAELSAAQDLQPLPVENLQQILRSFQQVAGEAVSQQTIGLAVSE